MKQFSETFQEKINKYYSKIYTASIHELEQYAYYILRCLHRCNIHITPEELTLCTFERDNGAVCQAIVYPRESIIDGEGIVNPMFLYGFKWDYDLRDLDHPVHVTFTEDYEELMK